MCVDQTCKGVTARCSLWWSQTPCHEDHTVGLIGHFAASDGQGAKQLLAHACEQLRDQGCTLALGPMDGNTWQSYRLVTEWGEEKSFFLEPQNPRSWPAYLSQSGFQPFAHYRSSLVTHFGTPAPALESIMRRLDARNVSIRALDVQQVEQELHQLYKLSTAAFRDNLLYTPVSEQAFLAQYQPLIPLLDPEMILIVEVAGRTIGFLLMLPDLAQAQRGEVVDRAIVKTVAVHPEYGHLGLGWVLGEMAHMIAHERGYQHVIHALMYEWNSSRKLSERYGTTMRRYALFSRNL